MVKAQERFLLMSCEALNSERAGAANERVQRTSGCSERASQNCLFFLLVCETLPRQIEPPCFS